MTLAEVLLWNELKGKKLGNRKFRRQHSIGNYIVDFYCPERKLTIEIEGSVHTNPGQNIYDGDRLKYLEERGLKVLFFDNKSVYDHMEMVLECILRELV